MARLRKAVAYRRLERPYTRKSKYRKRNFVRASPQNNVVRFDMGNMEKKFNTHLDLISKEDLQIRHNAIESARLTANRALEGKLGKSGFHLKIRIFPHHILRENPLAAGAGADRMSTGMKKSFGKPISLAARVKKGKVLMTLRIDKQNLPLARTALRRSAAKMPCTCSVQITEQK